MATPGCRQVVDAYGRVYTQLTPRWLAIGGYVVAVVLLIGSYYLDWSILVFPLWVLLVSICILLDKEKEPLA